MSNIKRCQLGDPVSKLEIGSPKALPINEANETHPEDDLYSVTDFSV